MTIDECIKEYRDFARQAFTQKPMQTAVSENSFVPTFSADRLRDATIKKILSGRGVQKPPEQQPVDYSDMSTREYAIP